MRGQKARRHRVIILIAGLMATVIPASGRSAPPPYDEARTAVVIEPDRSGNGAADATAEADQTTGGLSASASASGTLPAILPLTGNPGYNISRSQGYAAVEAQVPIQAGFHFVRVTFNDVRSTSQQRDDDPRSPAHGTLSQVVLSAVPFPSDACCPPGDLVEDIFSADSICTRPNQQACTHASTITLALPVRVPSGRATTLAIRGGLLVDAIAQGATSAQAEASARVVRVDVESYPWEEVPPGTDWTLRTIKAGPQGARGAATTLGILHPGDGANMVGFGLGGDPRFPEILVLPIGGGPTRLATTAGAGSIDVTLEPPRAPFDLIGFSANWEFALTAGQEAGLLVFAAGGRIPDVAHLNVQLDAGSIESMRFHAGSGSTVIGVAEPADDGIGLTAGPAAGGRSVRRSTIASGIAGGFPGVGFCGACDIEWQGPGRAGRWTAVSSDHLVHEPFVSVGRSSFSGPAGDWNWTFSGFGAASFRAQLTRAPGYAAYAPVGDDWILFS